MFVWWGPHLTNLYNDAYIPMLGARHPAALGAAAGSVWADVWGVVGPQADIVVREGRVTCNEELPLLMERNHFIEETYFTWSYSPIADDDGVISGVFCAVTEETPKVLGRRRLKTLRDLGERTLMKRSVEEAWHTAAETLAKNNRDLPFFLVYLLDADGKGAVLREAVGIGTDMSIVADRISIDSASDIWDFGRVLDTHHLHVVENLDKTFGRVPAGTPSGNWTRRALVAPLATSQGHGSLTGFLVAGISPHLSLDDEYRGFIGLVAAQLATTIPSTRAATESQVDDLESGAPDLANPFSLREMSARFGAHLETARVHHASLQKERGGALVAIEAIEAQRRQISRELHDELGQELTALVLGLKSVRSALPADSPVHTHLQRLQAMAAQMSQDVHRIALELRPGALDRQGLQNGSHKLHRGMVDAS